MPIRRRLDKEIWLPNAGRTCVLLHGWQGAPGHMEPMGRYLHRRGLSVWIPLLGEDAGDDLRQLCLGTWEQSPVVIGFSRGGLLALELGLSAVWPRALVTINAPLEFREGADVPRLWRKELARIRVSLPRVTVPSLIVQSDDDEIVSAAAGILIYESIASGCKELWSCPGDHMVILKSGREKLFDKIWEFVHGLEECG